MPAGETKMMMTRVGTNVAAIVSLYQYIQGVKQLTLNALYTFLTTRKAGTSA